MHHALKNHLSCYSISASHASKRAFFHGASLLGVNAFSKICMKRHTSPNVLYKGAGATRIIPGFRYKISVS